MGCNSSIDVNQNSLNNQNLSIASFCYSDIIKNPNKFND